jgi:hypothetical protein
VITCDPSLGVSLANIAHEFPPSVEIEMSTFAQFIGAAVVPATFHVMVWLVPGVQLTPADGEVTTNGPAAATVVTETLVSLKHPKAN